MLAGSNNNGDHWSDCKYNVQADLCVMFAIVKFQ